MQKLFLPYPLIILRKTSITNIISTRTIHHVSSINKEEVKDRKPTYDIVIFGATGFTGKYVVREAFKFINSPNSPLKTIALAGRNLTKLSKTLAWASPSHHTTTPFLIADITNSASLNRMASQAKLVLNCVGPFRHHGGPVVDACVRAGCDYLDVCGELEFIERVEAAYHDEAMENGSLVISACGIDSVPAELGFMFNCEQWVYPAMVNRVEAYMSVESDVRVVANSSTFESAVLGVANAHKLKEFRRARRGRKTTTPLIVGPGKNKVSSMIEHQKKIGLWAVKLPSIDTFIVKRTLAHLADNSRGLPGIKEKPEQLQKRINFWSKIKPAHFGMKIASKNLFNIFGFIAVGLSVRTLTKCSIGKWLLLKFPQFFSLGWFRKGGPTEMEIASSSFKMWFIGHGFSRVDLVTTQDAKPDMEIITRLKGPEFGYVSTSIILVQCALIVLKQREDLPKGGVYTPGIVFGPTDIQERLQENGISFDIISKSIMST